MRGDRSMSCPTRRSRRRGASVALFAAAVLGLAACDEAGGEERETTFAVQAWPELVMTTQVVEEILGEMGYTTETDDMSVEVTAEALDTDDVDVYLGNWWPSQEPTFGERIEDDEVDVVGTYLEGTEYQPAVPAYVADAGVTSFADLDDHADEFDRTIYGIEAGAPGNETIMDAIDDDAYGLGDWELVESSTPGMLAELESVYDEEEWIVFLGWTPHWMTVEYDLTFLEDPEDVWPGAGEVRAVTRSGLEDEDPDLVRLLSQLETEIETQSDWIHELEQEERAEEEVAREWLGENPDIVEGWLEGVETADGEDAAEVVPDAF
ncbi:ABC transporter substrate-binding protein [Egibacter rhizosphaerae]|uniref:ABC transporter substrate-binding protein n=1 Tax=Egibacter rhizosphaerae TaxID=1670831 RepID=A0A411YKD9_9ACTN|nr:ABC transporter substrate-binding protein [Egibacter rhizosphaerae]QBI21678.1 ABC transporter substrate-binding protein [Egibacter rhizosphaerae]